MSRGRKEKNIDNTTGAAAEFAQDLRNARHKVGDPPYRMMAADAHYSPTALSVAASGKRLPTWQVAEAYLRACDVTDFEPWKKRWDMARARVSVAKGKSRGGRKGIPHAVVAAPEDNRSGGDPHTAELRKRLDDLRVSKLLALRAVAAKSREIQTRARDAGRETRALSSTTIHEVLSGRRALDDEFVELYLMAIDATSDEQVSRVLEN